MTLRHLRIFAVVCRNDCSITRSAGQLHITQPAVSQAIRELEEYYSTRLFEREGRKLTITGAGERLLEYAVSIGIIYEDMEKELKNWGRQQYVRVGGTLTVGTHFLPRYVKLFKEAYPDIDVQVFCGPDNVLEHKILSNELDIAFSECVPTDPLIRSRDYMDDRLAAFCSADGPFEKGETVSFERFRQQPFILREQGSGTRKVFDMACEKLGFRASPVWESMSNTGVISAVENGLGTGVLSRRIITDAAEQGRINEFYVEGLDLDRRFHIISHRNRNLTPAAEYFVYLCNDAVFEVNENS